LTMFDSRTNLSVQVASEVKRFFREKVFDTIIPRNVKIAESPSFGKPVIYYDEASSGAKAYMALASEITQKGQEDEK
ncbi:MAG: ParA family protein, partial [Eubacteriaceae bacterium]|nr:ParA family protein [Eubacteriaceae bacterium]